MRRFDAPHADYPTTAVDRGSEGTRGVASARASVFLQPTGGSPGALARFVAPAHRPGVGSLPGPTVSLSYN